MIPVVSRRSLVRWRRSVKLASQKFCFNENFTQYKKILVDEDDGKLHVFPGEIPVKQLVFLRRWRRQREMTTHVYLVVEVLTRVFRRVG